MGREPRERNSVRRERNVTAAWKQNVCGAIISHSLFETWVTYIVRLVAHCISQCLLAEFHSLQQYGNIYDISDHVAQ